jgi:hypothetical protein
MTAFIQQSPSAEGGDPQRPQSVGADNPQQAVRVVSMPEIRHNDLEVTVILAHQDRHILTLPETVLFAEQLVTKGGGPVRGRMSQPHIYPVNKEGKVTDALATGKEPVAEYWARYRFSLHYR